MSFDEEALRYHREPRPGKTEVVPTKPFITQSDLSLAYSPGVAVPCREIEADPDASFEYTNRGNLIAVISNGTAVLGLGHIGPLAGKPVMEGKAVLFKKFANIDCFDIELATNDPDKIIETCAMLEPTFGGINLEDIKAPECFEIEDALEEPAYRATWHYLFGGGCATYEIDARGPGVVTIEDNGIGMDRETREKIFSLFFSSKGLKGTGLGLSIVHSIIESYDSRLEVGSRQGAGTTFSFCLKRIDPPTGA